MTPILILFSFSSSVTESIFSKQTTIAIFSNAFIFISVITNFIFLVFSNILTQLSLIAVQLLALLKRSSRRNLLSAETANLSGRREKDNKTWTGRREVASMLAMW